MTVNPGVLRKILELESKKGFPNNAVIGGLDKFISAWWARVQPSIPEGPLLKRVSALCPSQPGYALMSIPQRKKWSEAMLSVLPDLDKPQPVSPLKEVEIKKARAITSALEAPKTRVTVHPGLLDSHVTAVKGISDVLAKKFAKLGVNTVRDLLYLFPNRHLDYSQRAFINNLAINQENTIIANVWDSREVQFGLRKSTEATVGDETGNIRIAWFNQPYVARSLKTGQRIVFSGKVTLFNGMPVFESPEWEPYASTDLVHTGRFVPIYPLTQGLSQRQMRRILKPAVDLWSQQLEDFLPPDLVARLKLLPIAQAIRQEHYPDDEAKKDEARRRLAFDELFLLQLGVLEKKQNWQESQPGVPFNPDSAELDIFLTSLPYKLTSAQDKALNEILDDLRKSRPMSRLLQGEVGSGKTVVATAALILAVCSGFQGALMAPTEILAEQHFNTMRKIFSHLGAEAGEGNVFSYAGFLSGNLTVALLIGDVTPSAKKKIQERVFSGEINIVIGTHALIQKGMNFDKLGLLVVDEQHRFGVEQRSALRQKGTNPHVLVMTATPIPRTLALTLYGDLDLSVIDQLPPGRQEIKTRWLKPEQRASAYHFIRQQIKNGRQAFIVCPLVDESEVIQAKSAVAEYEQLSREVFPDLRLGLLHGRLSSSEKDTVMQQFHSGALDILVSTPVVEVGIDVPNATVMLIESADRFGLSQLHQFRGRVGRGPEQSYCMLLAEKPSEIGKKRLDLIERIHNGFILAEEDLKLRGPGEFFGTRQSGIPDLKMARLSDTAILELARKEAIRLFQEDSRLTKPEHRLLSQEMAKVWKTSSKTEMS